MADRENGRVLKYDTSLGKAMVFSESFEGFMGNVYAIAFNRTSSWPLYAVNGPADSVEESHGLSLQENGEVATIWGQEEVRVCYCIAGHVCRTVIFVFRFFCQRTQYMFTVIIRGFNFRGLDTVKMSGAITAQHVLMSTLHHTSKHFYGLTLYT